MKKNNGFTVAELAFVFTFIGVISVIALHTINTKFTDYYSRYSTAYDMLQKAFYHINADTYCWKECNDEDKAAGGRPFPVTAINWRNRLKEYLNVTKVSQSSSDGLIEDELINNVNDSPFENSSNIQLELTNGFRIYFSKVKKFNGSSIAESSLNNNILNDPDNHFRIVYVDLNGASKPNRVIRHPEFTKGENPNTVRPDIVPFIVTMRGDVIPVGFPIFDRSYLTARVINDQNEQSKSYSLYDAVGYAYGNAHYNDMPITRIAQFNELLHDGITMKKKETTSGTRELSVFARPKLPDILKNKKFDGSESDYRCKEGTFNCGIKLDINTGKRF